MLDWSLKECACIAGGLPPSARARVTQVCTDSRAAASGALFVALPGPRADGHDFVAAALAAGAAGALVAQGWTAPAGIDPARLVRVPCPLAALALLAAAHRALFAVPVVGVTGSSGKTTTKDMIAAALGPLGPVLRTPDSQNNEHGVPLALLRLDATHRAAVLEMGMRGPGQIAELCRCAQPTIGVITNIGLAHVGLLGSLEAIAAAKSELLACLPPEGVAILRDADVEHAGSGPVVLRESGSRPRRLFGETESAEYRLVTCDVTPTSTCAAIRTPEGEVRLTVVAPGVHHAVNAACALAAAGAAGVPAAEAARALDGFEPDARRGRQVHLPGGVTIVNESYNANPASMSAALAAFRSMSGRKLAALGDMLELGECAPHEHRLVGVQVAEAGVECLAAVGQYAGEMVAGAADRGLKDAGAFAQPLEAVEFLRQRLQSGGALMVKGSRGMRMEQIVEALANG